MFKKFEVSIWVAYNLMKIKTEAVLKLIKQCMIKERLSEAVSLMKVYV